MPKLRVNEIDLYYQVTGQGEPLVFIHGLGSSSRDWAFQVDHFYQDYQVVVFDVRGHGESDKPPGPYSVPLFAQDTAELLQALEIAPTHVVGVSMGGMIGFQLVLDAPELVRSLVVVNSSPELVARTLKDRLKVWQRTLIVRLLGVRKMGEVLADRLFPKPEQAQIHQEFIERWGQNDPRAYRESMRALVGWSVSDRLASIQRPVLVVTADQDYTPVSEKAAYTQRLPQGKLAVIEDSRHGTPADQPQVFNQVVGDFLKEHSAGGCDPGTHGPVGILTTKTRRRFKGHKVCGTTLCQSPSAYKFEINSGVRPGLESSQVRVVSRGKVSSE